MKLQRLTAIHGSDSADPAVIIRQVNKKLEDIIHEDLPVLKKVKKFVVKSGGKRIRPLVHYYLARVGGYQGRHCVDVGAIGEIIHAASLLHDDVVDEATQRRGERTVNASHGNKTAILSGDFLLACAFDHLQTLPDSSDLMAIFTRVVRQLAIGELLQLEWETNVKMPESVYERIILGKTASLFGAMGETAAVIARHKDRAKFREFGERLGRVFQIRDDFLDYFSETSATGKDNLQDFKRGLVTHPFIVIRKSASVQERRTLDRMLGSEMERTSREGAEFLMDLAAKRKVRQKLATEIEAEIHVLMHFVRSHAPSDHREGILKNIRSLSVAVS
ncbi:MAG: polyprenyl synthetase family protein [Spirochaetia bacterium]|nr:polyprenyl synthetase family protein [Spirochaetia bacterium]